MMITLTEAAKVAGISKGAVRKAALETRKLKAEKDEHGVWRVDAADVQRLWPQRPPLDTVTANQQSPITVSDAHHDAHQNDGLVRELRAKLEAAEQRIADKDSVIDDLRRRLDSETEERHRLTLALTNQRPRRRWWWPFGK